MGWNKRCGTANCRDNNKKSPVDCNPQEIFADASDIFLWGVWSLFVSPVQQKIDTYVVKISYFAQEIQRNRMFPCFIPGISALTDIQQTCHIRLSQVFVFPQFANSAVGQYLHLFIICKAQQLSDRFQLAALLCKYHTLVQNGLCGNRLNRSKNIAVPLDFLRSFCYSWELFI